jgi:RHS repeat-associated protein
VERYAYSPYGQRTVLDADWSADADGMSDVDNAVLYCGYHFDAETTLYHVRNRYYSTSLGRFITRDPLGYVDGMSVYEYVRSTPLNAQDAEGLGILGLYIKKITDYWDVSKEMAADHALELYQAIYKLATVKSVWNRIVMPWKTDFAREFLGRWLDKKGGTREFNEKEMESILHNRFVKQMIGFRLGQEEDPWTPNESYDATRHHIPSVSFVPGQDLFYGLGWFQLYATGTYCVSADGNSVEFKGTLELEDTYDWQDPGEKSVNILGDDVYDKWAEAVENHGLAEPFKVRGKLENITATYDLTADPLGVYPKKEGEEGR